MTSITNTKTQIKKHNRTYYLKHRDKIKLNNNLYRIQNREKIKKYQIQYSKAYKKLHKLQINARNMASAHIPLVGLCANCKERLAIQRHHLDYAKPLEVLLLCGECHHNLHNQLNNIGGNSNRNVKR